MLGCKFRVFLYLIQFYLVGIFDSIVFNCKNWLCYLRTGSGSHVVCPLYPFQSLGWYYHIKHKKYIQNWTNWKDLNSRAYVILIFRIETKSAHAAIKSDILFYNEHLSRIFHLFLGERKWIISHDNFSIFNPPLSSLSIVQWTWVGGKGIKKSARLIEAHVWTPIS